MNNDITCVILAGGLARRMGNIDKAFVLLAGKPLLVHVLDRMKPQTSEIIINANGDHSRFSATGLPVIADTIKGFAGPLAGILAAMEWVQNHRPKTRWIVSVPVDTPFVPVDLITRFCAAIDHNEADLACATSNDRHHPVVGMWPVALADNLRKAIIEEDLRKVDLWTGRFNLVHTEFDNQTFDPFFNINRPQDIKKAELALQE